jgi:hypothetical protein
MTSLGRALDPGRQVTTIRRSALAPSSEVEPEASRAFHGGGHEGFRIMARSTPFQRHGALACALLVTVTLSACDKPRRAAAPPKPQPVAAAAAPTPKSADLPVGAVTGAAAPARLETAAAAGPRLAGAPTQAINGRPAPSPLARVTPYNQPALEAAITEALDTGGRSHWNDEVGAYSGEARPGAARGDGCRAYSYTVQRGAERWASPARIACRDEDGGWRLR